MTEQSDDHFWERLLQDIESGLVVPIIGRDLIVVDTDEGPDLFHRVVAKRLADSLGVDRTQLPPAFDTNDVICAYQGFHGNPGSQLSRVVSIVKSLKPQVPRALQLLAEIPTLRLFVTTTFDNLMEEALRAQRPRPPAVLSFPAVSSQADFNEELLEDPGSVVFHMLGRCAGSSVFSVTEGQTLELMHQLLSGDRRPVRLLDKLRDSHLLLLGVGLPDWLSRFLLRVSRNKPLWDSRDRNEVIAENFAPSGELPLFLHRFSPDNSYPFPGGTLEAFVEELHRRWFAQAPVEAPPVRWSQAQVGDDEPDKMERGSVFISYATEDRQAAFALADHLAERGIETWVDRRLNPGNDFRHVIERHIRECSAFVAVMSNATQLAGERWFRREWAQAIDRSTMTFGTDLGFLFPVVVDHVSMQDLDDTLNRLFRRTAVVAPAGLPTDDLVRELARSQRAWRKQFAVRT